MKTLNQNADLKDVLQAFTAKKYHYDAFVTHDKNLSQVLFL